MKLLKYAYEDEQPNIWKVSEFELNKVNLLAGLSGVGKTRTLNTINNLSLIVQKKRAISTGKWKFAFQINKDIYNYFLDIKKDEKTGNAFISKEVLSLNTNRLIDRTKNKFFLEEKQLQYKLSSEDIGLYLFRDESKIKKVYDEFRKIYIRRFNPDNPSESIMGPLPKKFLLEKPEKVALKNILLERHINVQLYLLKEYHPKIYKKIEEDFKEIFPFVLELFNIKPINEIKNIDISDLPLNTSIPVLVIKEKNIKQEIALFELSSGMKRALIHLIDIYTIPKNSIYLIDELENCMGVKSLPVMLEILMEKSNDIQFIFTTHHPYIFNNVNINYWKVLTRKGSNITVIDGKELKKKFSKSYQEDYIQLINSELFEKGI